MLRWRGREAEKLIKETAMQAMHDGAEHILTESIDETPIDTGTLRRSGAVTDALQEDSVYISYNTPYAVKQHEDLSLRHTDGKPKYLENPFNRNKQKVVRLANDRVRRALHNAR